MALTRFTNGIQAPNVGQSPEDECYGEIFFVCNRSGCPAGTGRSPDDPASSLNTALGLCVAGRGDKVKILPGHVETISSADQMSNLVSNVTIEGVGRGNQRPILRWTAATATFLFDQAGTVLRNCRLQMAGDPDGTTALTVAAPITVSAAGCAIMGCEIQAGVDADQLVTIGITTTAAADQFRFLYNVVRGAAAATGTTFLRLVGLSDCEIGWNDIVYGTSAAAVGPIQALTTAPVDANIHDNWVQNIAANSTACITGMAGMTGHISYNLMRNMTDASVAHIATPGNTQGFENRGVNNNGEYGILIGTASV